MGFFVRVFKNADAEQDGLARQDDAGRGGDRPSQAEFMHVQSALVLAASDGEHLAKSRFDRPPEGRVELYPVDQDEVIGLQRIPRDEDFGPGIDTAQGNGIHATIGSARRPTPR